MAKAAPRTAPLMRNDCRAIPGFPGYSIDPNGVVYGKTGAPMSPQIHPIGYLALGLWVSGKRTTKRIHNLVASAWLPPKPSCRHEVAHNNGNKLDNRSSNLRWALHVENGADMVAHGRSTQGVRHPNVKINELIVKNVRAVASSGVTYKEVGEQFGLSRQHIRKIVAGLLWGHIPGAITEKRKTGPRPRV